MTGNQRKLGEEFAKAYASIGGPVKLLALLAGLIFADAQSQYFDMNNSMAQLDLSLYEFTSKYQSELANFVLRSGGVSNADPILIHFETKTDDSNKWNQAYYDLEKIPLLKSYLAKELPHLQPQSDPSSRSSFFGYQMHYFIYASTVSLAPTVFLILIAYRYYRLRRIWLLDKARGNRLIDDIPLFVPAKLMWLIALARANIEAFLFAIVLLIGFSLTERHAFQPSIKATLYVRPLAQSEVVSGISLAPLDNLFKSVAVATVLNLGLCVVIGNILRRSEPPEEAEYDI